MMTDKNEKVYFSLDVKGWIDSGYAELPNDIEPIFVDDDALQTLIRFAVNKEMENTNDR